MNHALRVRGGRWIILVALALATIVSSTVSGSPARAASAAPVDSAAPAASSSTTISVNGGSSGRTFDGIGAISGGGGNSRLLIDYPAAQQQPDPRLPVQARLRRRTCRS